MNPRQENSVLELRGLTVKFPRIDGTWDKVVRAVDLHINRGEIVGLVGESGSGKTMVGLSLLDLVPQTGIRTVDSVRLNGHEITDYGPEQTRALRGREIAMVFQDPMSSFNPVRTVGAMMLETVLRYQEISIKEARTRCVEAMSDVGIPVPEQRFGAYPHELSGGLRQRVMIALATLNNPSLLIADEPTTALDSTIQAQILDLLKNRIGERCMILVTHDLGVAAEICDRIVVMKRGEFIESGECAELLARPQHEYTKSLIRAVPSFRRPYVVPRSSFTAVEDRPLLEGKTLRVTFKTKGQDLHAVNGVDISLSRGETVGLVGESGSGKSTLISALMGIHRPTQGSVFFDGQDITDAREQELKPLRRRLQLVFQDPYASLNPRWTVRKIVAEPLRAQRLGTPKECEGRVREVLSLVGLPDDSLHRRPSQFSGGQRQRIAIARALALQPEILIADEPVAGLDVSMQAQIVALLKSLQSEFGIGYLIVAHDLALMHHIADRLVVMYLGEIVEEAEGRTLTRDPLHPYTAALLSAAPDSQPERRSERISLRGEQPSPLNLPSGCAFHTRCPIARPLCSVEKPTLTESHGRHVACHFPGELRSTETGEMK